MATGPVRVLLIEDNPGDARLLSESLERSTAPALFNLTHVERLGDALTLLSERAFDAALLDLGLPDSHGLNTLRRVRSAAADLPIVVLTGFEDDDVEIEALREGAQDYLSKGHFDRRLLTRALRYAIERKRGEEALRRSEESATRLARENAVLAEIGRVVSSSLDLSRVFIRFAELARELVPFDRIVISVLDDSGKQATSAHVGGVDIPGWEQGSSHAVRGTLIEELVQTYSGLVVRATDAPAFRERLPAEDIAVSSGLRSLIGVPLISNGTPIGTLVMRGLEPDSYSEEDLAAAGRIGYQIAGGVAGSRLYAERIRAESALRSSEERLRAVVTNAPVVLFALDGDGLSQIPHLTLLGMALCSYSRCSVSIRWSHMVRSC